MYYSSRQEIDIGIVQAIIKELVRRSLIPNPFDFNNEDDYQEELMKQDYPIIVKGTGGWEERGKLELDTFVVHFLNMEETTQIGKTSDVVFVSKGSEGFEKQKHPETAYDLLYKVYLAPTPALDYVLQNALLSALKNNRFYPGYKVKADGTGIEETFSFQIQRKTLTNISVDNALEYAMDVQVLNVYLDEFEIIEPNVPALKEVKITLEDKEKALLYAELKIDSKSN